jgi:hypothetical protein
MAEAPILEGESWVLSGVTPGSVSIQYPETIDPQQLQVDIATLNMGIEDMLEDKTHTPQGCVLAAAKEALGLRIYRVLYDQNPNMSVKDIALVLQSKLITGDESYTFTYTHDIVESHIAVNSPAADIIKMCPTTVIITRLADETEEVFALRVGYLLQVAESLITLARTQILQDLYKPNIEATGVI